MRILYLINDMGYGGAELQVLALAKEFAARGHQVGVCVLVDFLALEQTLTSAGIQTFALRMEYGRARPSDLFRLAAVCREFRPDVVHAHLFSSCLAARLVRALAPVRAVINTSHSPWESSKARYLALGATEFLAEGWTSVCAEGVRNHVRAGAVSNINLGVVPNGLDLTQFAQSPDRDEGLRHQLGMPDGFVWLAVGSFRSEQKDYDTLLAAIAIAAKQRDFTLWIAGEGPLLEQKRALARELSVENRVRFLGLRGDVGNLMRCADGFVLASAWEAMPIVLLEAAASWLPVVATDVGDNCQIVGGDRGILVQSKAPEQLATAMLRLMDLPPPERVAIADRARSHIAANYSLSVVASLWEDIYIRATTRRPSRIAGRSSKDRRGSRSVASR